MTSIIDPAILKALALDAASTTLASHGGSRFTKTFKLSSKDSNGKDKLFFVKTGEGKASKVMFAGEHMSLNAIHSSVPTLCPTSHAHGPLSSSSPNTFFLATSFLSLSSFSSSTKPGSGQSLAQKLAKLHSTPAPVPEGYTAPQFGFPLPTCCGDTQQDNSYRSSWSEFYADCRLRHVLSCAEKNNGSNSQLASLVEKTASTVVPCLLRDGHLKSPNEGDVVPVVVHGDLWSGNHGHGTISGESEGMEEIVFDPSSCWAHSEFDFGIMRMFGGFGSSFEKEYHKCKAKDEPAEEYEDRVMLYELYHHLNHYSIFGGTFKSGAERIMKVLIRKYGEYSQEA